MIISSLLISIFLILYSILILEFRSAWNRSPEHLHVPGEGVFLSVIVPFHNEADNLERLILDLKAQDYPQEKFEVILIDDHSEDSSFNFAKFLSKGSSNFRVIKNNLKQGKKFALKAAAESAIGDFLLITDADCRLPSGWISSFGYYYSEQSEMILVSSGVKMTDSDSFFSKFQALEFSSLVASGAASFFQKSPVMCNGANLSFRRSLFLRAFNDLHPEINTGDDMFLMLFAKKFYPGKMSFLKNHNAFTQTYAKKNWRSYFSQRVRWSSKSMLYRDWKLIYSSIIVFMVNLILLLSVILSFFDTDFIAIFLSALIIKSIPDFLFLRSFLKFSGQSGLLNFFLPSQIIYIFFIPITAVTGLIFKVKTGNR